MAENNSSYWKKRMTALEEKQYQKSAVYYQDMQKQYQKAATEIAFDIEHWYQRLADNNDISLAAAKRLLKKEELKEFHWSVAQYIKAGNENAVSQCWMKELENASAKFHISYLGAMKMQMQQHIEWLSSQLERGMTKFLYKTYETQFYRTAFEIAKGTGVGSNLARLDTRKIELLLKKPWVGDGKNFSDRIWENKHKLVNHLHTELAQNIIRGTPPDKAIENLSKVMNVSKKQAGKLIMTESAAISSKAQQDCYEELGVEEFEVVETLDGITCEICQEMDGKHFPMSDFQIGETAPPFHPNCRGCTCPWFEEDFGKPGQRAARNPNTKKTYYVSADMTYKKWKESFVEDGDKADLIPIPQIQDEKIRKANDEFSKILYNTEATPFTDKMILYNGATEYQLNEKLEVAFAYNLELDVIQYNPLAKYYECYDMNFVQAHELSHRMDILEYHSWENQKFLQAIENSRKKIYDNHSKIKEWFSEGGKYNNDLALSDIFSALSYGELNEILCCGHSIDYWQDSLNTCLEIFADITAIDVIDYHSKEEFSGILKELYEAYRELIK